jgi:hypothetical protein
MRERDICYAIWRARKTDGDKARLKLIRRRVTRLVRIAKISYITKFRLSRGVATAATAAVDKIAMISQPPKELES